MNGPEHYQAARRKLPGRAKPAVEALRWAEGLLAQERARYKHPVIGQLLVPSFTSETFRWRVQLGCGCVHELLTRGKECFPLDQQSTSRDPWDYQPPGQLDCCIDKPAYPSEPYRELVAWGEEREIFTLPPDPIEPQHGLDARAWARIRHGEERTHAQWTVTLSCGHLHHVSVDDVEWEPSDWPVRVSGGHQEKLVARWQEMAKFSDDYPEWQHRLRMAEGGWGEPFPEQACYRCLWARPIVAYEPVGPLLLNLAKAKPPTPPSRITLERKLRQAEAEADRLRAQLNDAAPGRQS